ncbi:MAG: hypothetical protein LBH35_02265 [Treponema sp.]|nr:hypothetical protein [Treponema sp.]
MNLQTSPRMKRVLLGLMSCFALFFFSCGDFFTTSLASWARRDPSSLIPPVTAGNVSELLELTENNPDQALALLKGIKDAGAGPTLQAAALQAASNASGLGAAILQHADDIGNINETNAKEIVIDTLNGLGNVVEAGTVLEEILPDPSSAADWNAFVAVSGAEDLAMAAALLLAGKAKASGDPDAYITGFSSISSPDSTEVLAKELADAARNKHSGGGFLEDILSGLNLT